MRPAILLWIAYTFLSLLTLATWSRKGWYSVTGDETHYIVMADSIIHDVSLDTRNAYIREFRTKKIYAPGLASVNAVPSEKNTHAIEGPNGLFSVHSPGLPLLFALPYYFGGVIAIRIFMVMISSLLVYFSWRLSSRISDNEVYRIISVAGLIIGPPFIQAANQIFPDLIGGLFIFVPVVYILEIYIDRKKGNKYVMYLAFLMVTLLPWLHLKYAVAAVILAIAFIWLWFKTYIKYSEGVFFASGVFLSLLMLGFYNKYAFGNISGPYNSAALGSIDQTLLVFLGLHLDRSQGLLLQNYLFIFAFIYLIPFMKKSGVISLLLILLYLSLMIPNAAHTNFYGGYSFVGRFAWSGTVIIIPFALSGLVSAMKDKWRLAYIIIGTGILSNILVIIYRIVERFPYYNIITNDGMVHLIRQEAYISFFPFLNEYMPAFYSEEWFLIYSINIVYILTFIFMILTGFAYAKKYRREYFYGMNILMFVFVVTVLVAKNLYSNDLTTRYCNEGKWSGSSLPSITGKDVNGARQALEGITKPGFLTFGPYVRLDYGSYILDLDTVKSGDYNEVIGKWDIYIPYLNRTVDSGEIYSTSANDTPDRRKFEINRDEAGYEIEVRTYYTGKGSLSVRSLDIRCDFEASKENLISDSPQD